MIQLDYRDHRPLFEQIKEKLRLLMINGVLKADEKLPSVRELAQSLIINPNTIQKAYRDLEAEGFIYSIRSKGSFVTPLKASVNPARQTELMEEIGKLAAELRYMNVPEEQVIQTIVKAYSKKEVGKND